VVVIETPFDEDIIILQREINGTVIPYRPRAMQKRTEDKTMQLSKLVANRDRYVADARAKAPPKASSFDRVVEDTLKAQIKR
jgi:hypothetical protein